MASEELLMVFVKNKRLGKVKTRLADTVGDEKAMQIYNRLLRYSRDVVASLEVDVQVWYSDFIPLNDIWNSIGAEKRTQVGDDLGDRMKHAFHYAFSQYYDRVVVIGSDCAEITTSLLRKAFRKLRSHDTVIGPSRDGGYYLLGMDAFQGDLFDDKQWSTEDVYRQTIDDIAWLDLSCSILDELNDVDTWEDWESVKSRFADISV